MASSSSVSKLPVTGYDVFVTSLRGKLLYLKQLQNEVSEAKEAFRAVARETVARLPNGTGAAVTSLEFLSTTGETITVSLPDVTRAGNRIALSEELLGEVAQDGLDISEMLETEEVIELRGDYVPWLKNLLQQWKQQGVTVPENGLTIKQTTRLSVDGVSKLKQIASAGGTLAQKVLGRAIKAATVGFK